MTKVLILTTGPMKIPAKITGDPVGGPPDVIHILMKNPTAADAAVQLFADVCDGTDVETTFPDAAQIIPPNGSLTRTFSLSAAGGPGDTVRFFAKGNLTEQMEKLELSFVGQRTSDEMNEPTLLFRNADLIEIEIHEDHVAPNVNPWGN
jgi:hypothetical protein